MKRKITLVVLLATGVFMGYLSFVAWSVGFLLARYVGKKAKGKETHRLLKSFIIPLGRYGIHIHHWIWSSVAILTFTLLKGAHVLPTDLFYGFFGAIVFHGIFYYSDWYRILFIRKVRDLAIAEKLALEKVAFAAVLLEIKQKVEEGQIRSQVSSLSSHYTVSPIEGSP